MAKIDISNDLDFLKWQAEIKGEHMHLSRAASKELKNLLMTENISPEEFSRQLDNVFFKTKSVSWQIHSFFSKNNIFFTLENLVNQIAWSKVCILFSIIFSGYIFYQKYKTNDTFIPFFTFIKRFIANLCAAFAYFFPFAEFLTIYTAPLVRTYPYLNYILGDASKLSLYIFQTVPAIGFIYFCLVYGYFLRYRRPRNRFIRFHLAHSLMIENLHQPLVQIYYILLRACEGNQDTMESLALTWLIIIMLYVLPAIYRALRGEYTKNPFMRDAIEIIVGYDAFNPNFKWWNRK